MTDSVWLKPLTNYDDDLADLFPNIYPGWYPQSDYIEAQVNWNDARTEFDLADDNTEEAKAAWNRAIAEGGFPP